MTQCLKYLKKYEEEGNNIIFYLHDYPSCRKAGNKFVRELYIYLFHDETIQLNRVHKIDELIYLIQKEQKYFCLNCKTPLFFDVDSNYISICEKCNWRNELNDTPAIDVITIKNKTSEGGTFQIAYPLLEKQLLKYLPKKLGLAVETFLREPENLTKEQYQNIYHNIYEKENGDLSAKIEMLQTRKRFALFFQKTNFI